MHILVKKNLAVHRLTKKNSQGDNRARMPTPRETISNHMTPGDTSLVYTPVAKIGDVAVGAAVRIGIHGLSLALFNLDGVYYATAEICTHADVSLVDGYISGETVECPLHGSCFSIKTGQVLSSPATDALATYPVRLEGDHILIGLPK